MSCGILVGFLQAVLFIGLRPDLDLPSGSDLRLSQWRDIRIGLSGPFCPDLWLGWLSEIPQDLPVSTSSVLGYRHS